MSHVLPPTWSGQAMILEQLLRTFDPATYVLIRTDTVGDNRSYVPSLPARVFDLPEDSVAHSRRGLLGKFRVGRGLRAMHERTSRIAEIAAEEGCGVVVGCTGGDLLDIPAAFSASRRVGARFVAYYFDYWSQQSPRATQRYVAERIEARILRKADAVIVPNEFLADELRRRYGILCTIVRNACEGRAYATPEPEASNREQATPASIVYTGAVYEANIDAFRTLITAVESIDLDVTIEIFSAQSASALTADGLAGPVEIHGHRPTSEIRTIQQKADVLFLPLAFGSPYPRIIQTSSPAKMCEYLSSGRPILVHAPPGTFVSEYFREHGCGVVVDEPDSMLLADALHRLLEDHELRSRVISAALARANADYDLESARATFAATLGLRPPSPSSAAGTGE